MSETTVLIELAKQVPSLCVLVGLVIVFLKHMTAEGQANRTANTTNAQVVAKALDSHSTALTDLRVDMARSRDKTSKS